METVGQLVEKFQVWDSAGKAMIAHLLPLADEEDDYTASSRSRFFKEAMEWGIVWSRTDDNGWCDWELTPTGVMVAMLLIVDRNEKNPLEAIELGKKYLKRLERIGY